MGARDGDAAADSRPNHDMEESGSPRERRGAATVERRAWWAKVQGGVKMIIALVFLCVFTCIGVLWLHVRVLSVCAQMVLMTARCDAARAWRTDCSSSPPRVGRQRGGGGDVRWRTLTPRARSACARSCALSTRIRHFSCRTPLGSPSGDLVRGSTWCNYHLAAGFERLFIYFDDRDECAPFDDRIIYPVNDASGIAWSRLGPPALSGCRTPCRSAGATATRCTLWCVADGSPRACSR